MSENVEWIPRATFLAHEANLTDRIFGPKGIGIISSKDSDFFRDASWPTALVPVSPAHFSRTPLIELDDDDVFSPFIDRHISPNLRACIRNLGTSPVVFSIIGKNGFEKDEQGALLFDGSRMEDMWGMLAELSKNLGYHVIPNHFLMFDRSARWGLLVDNSEEVSILGGDPAFMAEFYRLCGGKKVLRDLCEDLSEADPIDWRAEFPTVWKDMSQI